ncbi:hypothetical protein E4U54_004498, partial [Claviceps lovelessii]
LEALIEAGRIPYIELRLAPRGQLVASLRSFRDSIAQGPHNRCVIFSHVWADGLGNPRDNALPVCQLRRFYDMLEDSPWEEVVGRQMLGAGGQGRPGRPAGNKAAASSAHRTHVLPPRALRRWTRRSCRRPVNIWIDTLCVPLAPGPRATAIGMLKRYYGFAAMTAVLDSSLCGIRLGSCSDAEALLRVGLSSWMSRCWTMQEAVISGGALMVRFADGWLPLLDHVALVRRKSPVISVNVMHDAQQARVRHWRRCLATALTGLSTLLSPTHPGRLCAHACRRALCCSCCRPATASRQKKHTTKKNNIRLQQGRTGASETDRSKGAWIAASPRLLYDAKQLFTSLAALSHDAAADPLRRIILSWNGLRHRNTSRPSDRFLNFAFACAREDDEVSALRGVLRLPVQERLRAWYLAQRALPADLLFVRGPRMDVGGFRWAPADIWPATMDDVGPARCLRAREAGVPPGDNAGPAPGSGSVVEGSLCVYKPALLLGERPGHAHPWRVRDCTKDVLHRVVLDEADHGVRLRGSAAVILRGDAAGDLDTTTTVGAVVDNVRVYAARMEGSFVCRAVVTGAGAVGEDAEEAMDARAAEEQTWVVS